MQTSIAEPSRTPFDLLHGTMTGPDIRRVRQGRRMIYRGVGYIPGIPTTTEPSRSAIRPLLYRGAAHARRLPAVACAGRVHALIYRGVPHEVRR